MFLSVEIKNLLHKGVIEECHHEEGEYIFPISLTPKSDGSFKMILNFKKLNDHMPYIHFKMETDVLNLVTPNCYMAKIDIKDAYFLSQFYLNTKGFWNLVCEESFINSLVFLIMDCVLVLENLLNYSNHIS